MNKNTRVRKKRQRQELIAQRRSTTPPGEGEVVVSQCPERNMETRIIRFMDPETHKMQSRTLHCKINQNKEARPKPRRDRTGQKPVYTASEES